MKRRTMRRVRLDSPYGFATVDDANGRRHLSNGTTGTVLRTEASGGLIVELDFPAEGVYSLPSHWLVTTEEYDVAI